MLFGTTVSVIHGPLLSSNFFFPIYILNKNECSVQSFAMREMTAIFCTSCNT